MGRCRATIVKDMSSDALGLYISIPFCRSKCTYCNFASGVYPASEHARYVDRLIEDMAAASCLGSAHGRGLPRRVDTVYLGGGTPSLLAPELLTRLFAAVRAEFDLAPEAEITVECAPGQLSGRVDAGGARGIGREPRQPGCAVVSLTARLHASGRLHNRAIVLDDIAPPASAGISQPQCRPDCRPRRADSRLLG
jgi:oxygen-independent coproporphyrinogen-3 oxidase